MEQYKVVAMQCDEDDDRRWFATTLPATRRNHSVQTECNLFKWTFSRYDSLLSGLLFASFVFSSLFSVFFSFVFLARRISHRNACYLSGFTALIGCLTKINGQAIELEYRKCWIGFGYFHGNFESRASWQRVNWLGNIFRKWFFSHSPNGISCSDWPLKHSMRLVELESTDSVMSLTSSSIERFVAISSHTKITQYSNSARIRNRIVCGALCFPFIASKHWRLIDWRRL